MQINGVCKYTETCEYEANKIHICLDLLRSTQDASDITFIQWLLVHFLYISVGIVLRFGYRDVGGVDGDNAVRKIYCTCENSERKFFLPHLPVV